MIKFLGLRKPHAGIYLLLLSITFLLSTINFGCSDGSNDASNDEEETTHERLRTVVIIIDGLRSDEFYYNYETPEDSYLPYFWGELVHRGTFFPEMKNDSVTVTSSAHATALTGQNEIINFIVTAESYEDFINNPYIFPFQPFLYEIHRSQTDSPYEKTCVISNVPVFKGFEHSLHPLFGERYEGNNIMELGSGRREEQGIDELIYETAKKIFETNFPDFVLINFHETDDKGHTGNWNAYIEAIRDADYLIYNLIDFIESLPYYTGRTVYLISTDHGRHDDLHGGFKDHGCGCKGCRKIFLLAIGPNIEQGRIVEKEYYFRDLGPTVMKLFSSALYPLIEGRAIPEIVGEDPEERVMCRFPSIDAQEEMIHLAYEEITQSESERHRILYANSTDGRNFTSPAVISESSIKSIHPALTALGKYVTIAFPVYYEDFTGVRTYGINIARGIDGGERWEYNSSFESKMESIHAGFFPSINPIETKDDPLLVLYSSHQGILSKDGGRNWSLTSEYIHDLQLAYSNSIRYRDGTFYILTEVPLDTFSNARNHEIYFTFSEDPIDSWNELYNVSKTDAPSRFPALVINGDRFHIFWSEFINEEDGWRIMHIPASFSEGVLIEEDGPFIYDGNGWYLKAEDVSEGIFLAWVDYRNNFEQVYGALISEEGGTIWESLLSEEGRRCVDPSISALNEEVYVAMSCFTEDGNSEIVVTNLQL